MGRNLNTSIFRNSYFCILVNNNIAGEQLTQPSENINAVEDNRSQTPLEQSEPYSEQNADANMNLTTKSNTNRKGGRRRVTIVDKKKVDISNR